MNLASRVNQFAVATRVAAAPPRAEARSVGIASLAARGRAKGKTRSAKQFVGWHIQNFIHDVLCCRLVSFKFANSSVHGFGHFREVPEAELPAKKVRAK